jgi:hypothetical protein
VAVCGCGEIRGNVGAHFNREVRSEAIGYLVALESTSAEMQGPKP